MMKEGGEEPRAGTATADALERLAGGVAELPNIFGAEVGEFVLFPIGPEVFDGIEFRGVGRQTIHPPAGVVLLDRRPTLFGAGAIQTIPAPENGARNPVQEVRDEAENVGAGDGTPQQTEVGVGVGRDRREG